MLLHSARNKYKFPEKYKIAFTTAVLPALDSTPTELTLTPKRNTMATTFTARNTSQVSEKSKITSTTETLPALALIPTELNIQPTVPRRCSAPKLRKFEIFANLR